MHMSHLLYEWDPYANHKSLRYTFQAVVHLLADSSELSEFAAIEKRHCNTRMKRCSASARGGSKIYVVEHLDPEMGPWSTLEYRSIAEESKSSGARFCLSSVSPLLQLPPELQETEGLEIRVESVEQLFATEKGKVCLLDPAASKELSPDDADQFDVFLFGGILG